MPAEELAMRGMEEYEDGNYKKSINYFQKLKDIYPSYSAEFCMHECVLTPGPDMLAKGLKTLDDWMGRFGIVHYERHNALADSLCTAQLFQVLLARAGQEGYSTVKDLLRAEKNYHWQRKR